MAGRDAVDPAIVDRVLLGGLENALGAAAVARYVERALGEAEAVLVRLAAPGLPADAARLLGHRLRGTAASFGLVGVAAAAARLEAGEPREQARTALAEAVRATRAALMAAGLATAHRHGA